MIVAAILVLVGFGFKMSAVPFHFWAPDVYEGAPTPVAAFLSTASKAAGFAVLARMLLSVFTPAISAVLGGARFGHGGATMTLGNLVALAQKNIKRLLAYSSIAHAGYALIGLATLNPSGLAAAADYLLAYALSNLAAFALVVLVSNVAGSDDLTALAGLSRRSPGAALAMLAAFLSLAGMPPFALFSAKLFLFASAVEANLTGLAVVAAVNSVIGLYYYLSVMKAVYVFRSETGTNPVFLPARAPSGAGHRRRRASLAGSGRFALVRSGAPGGPSAISRLNGGVIPSSYVTIPGRELRTPAGIDPLVD